MNVMIVDDSSMIRHAIGVWLTKTGSTIVAEAKNGLEAIDLFRRHKPDLVTLDITMPEMDGLETLGHLMQINPDACVIVISALTAREVAVEALKKGARTFLQKPFNSADLMEAIQEVTGNA